ncbi:30S ribosomal protein S11 [Orientia tsutsugamushi]|uniref:Small ribosomal subunit protein uS11 n=1 Tax=Orientia tsutsugamushi str. TA716 TaxID=1359175 RepID=A0A0F3PEG3_ORITS|nr:30S ribosomal protein S11 [Orientia tsutsugamushi]KJV77609.1 30S ribosomal protein S11 [Orientia tsutsugamushi str. TA716]
MYNAKTKKKKKNITLGIVYIKSTFNNTIVTFTDMQGNAIAALSAGAIGFKGAKKATPYAAQVIVEKVSEVAKEHGIKTLSIRIQGAGSQRESALRAIFNQNFIVTSITDTSPVAHNGCRPPKKRRV